MASVERLLGKTSTHPCSGVRHARFAMAKGGVWGPSGETLAARPECKPEARSVGRSLGCWKRRSAILRGRCLRSPRPSAWPSWCGTY
jgi:hypothetical protein